MLVNVQSTTPESTPGANDGAVDINVSGGSGNYSYLWSNGAMTQDISGLSCGTYSVTVTDTQIANCSVGTQAVVAASLGEIQVVNVSGGPCNINQNLVIDSNGQWQIAVDPIPSGIPSGDAGKKFYIVTVTRPNGTTKFTVVFGAAGDNLDASVSVNVTQVNLPVGGAGHDVGVCTVE